MIKNKKITLFIYSLLFVIMLWEWIVLQNNTDLVGFSQWELSLLNLVDLLSFVILPLFTLVVIVLDKTNMVMLIVMLRSGLSIVSVSVFAYENLSMSFDTVAQIIVNLVYIVLVGMIFYDINKKSKLLIPIVACRVLYIVLFGYISTIFYSLSNGYNYAYLNILYAIASELFMILPIVNIGKNKK